MAKFYIAGLVPEDSGGWSVYFPDVPNVAAGGETIEEALINAADGLYVALRDLAEQNAEMPTASSLEEVRAKVKAERELDELPFPEETLFQFVEAPSVDMVPVRVNITVPRSVLTIIDAKAKQAGYTRSSFLAQAALAYN